ncbi:MAG: PD-(D/E)XK nuclease family transposase [Bacilli bacterium]|nr:PD-(D/E)XK nuclease family transposase [Bacilli bacterium]
MKTSLVNGELSRIDSYILKGFKKRDKFPIVSDIMFHTMFNETRKKYVCYFISLVTQINYNDIYEKIIFLNSLMDKTYYHEPKKTVDLVCQIDKLIINIEMNNSYTLSILERNIEYANDLYKSKRIIGDKKYKYADILQININNFTISNNRDTISMEYTLGNKDEIYSDKIKYINIYLPNIRRKFKSNKKLTELEKLMIVFNEHKSKRLEKLIEGNEIMMDFYNEAIETSRGDIIYGLYDKEKLEEFLYINSIDDADKRGEKRGFERGEKIGIEQGKNTARIEIAKDMLKDTQDLSYIAKLTKLPIKEIKKIAKG